LKVTHAGRRITVEVTPDGDGLVSHAGSALLAQVADKTGLTRALTRELAGLKQRRSGHDHGRVVRDLAVMLAAGGEHHRQIANDAPVVVARPPLLQASQLTRQRPRQPGLVSDLRQQRAARMRHQPVSVRRDFYGNPAPSVRHLQGDPPESVLRASTTRRIPARADSQAAPTIGAAAASCTIRARSRRSPHTGWSPTLSRDEVIKARSFGPTR